MAWLRFGGKRDKDSLVIEGLSLLKNEVISLVEFLKDFVIYFLDNAALPLLLHAVLLVLQVETNGVFLLSFLVQNFLKTSLAILKEIVQFLELLRVQTDLFLLHFVNGFSEGIFSHFN